MRLLACTLLALASLAACGGKGTTVGGARSGGDYCDLAKSLDEENPFEGETPDFSNPSAFEKALATFQTKGRAVLKSAPAEIKADLELLLSATAEIGDALKAADYDFAKMDPATFAKFQDPKYQEASDRVEEYNKRVCGIEPSAS